MKKRESFDIINKLLTTRDLERNQNIKVVKFMNQDRNKFVSYTCNLSGDLYLHKIVKVKKIGYVFDQSFEPLMGIDAEAKIAELTKG